METQTTGDNFCSTPDFDLESEGCQAEDLGSYVSRGLDQVQDIVRDNAGRSMLVALAAGLGVGVILGTALGKPRRSTSWWDRQTAENLGSQILAKAESLVPDAISERFRQ